MLKLLCCAIALMCMLVSCRTTVGFGGNHFKARPIRHAEQADPQPWSIQYAQRDDPYLERLRKTYPLDSLLEGAKTDTERVLRVLNWTNSRWKHDGGQSPKGEDAIAILDEANAGGRFPCFAYAIVLKDQLSALGYAARTVYLKTKNARKSKKTPGHVVTEVFLAEHNKWVFLDGQFNVMPVLDGVPLNAVEFQQAVSRNTQHLELKSVNPIARPADYIYWVYPYLYYLDTSLNQYPDSMDSDSVSGKSSVMLVPKGAPKLSRVGFWDMDIDYCYYTNASATFYAPPRKHQ